MRPECIQAVQQAIGRPINQAESEGIVDRIGGAMRQLARQDPNAWRALTEAERLQQAAQQAAADLVAEAGKKKQRVALTILAHDANMNRYGELVQSGMRPFQAIGRILENADAYAKGAAKEAFSSLMDAIEAASPRFLGFVEDARFAGDFVREIYGQASGNADAAKAAKAWSETADGWRQRFNAAGGDVGKLDYGYIPQPHNQARVAQVGRDQWVKETLPLMDRGRYFNEDGTAMNDTQLADFLGKAWETIATGGLNKMEAGQRTGPGMLAKRHADARQIHFKDADAWMAYQSSFGKGSLFSAMQGHIGAMVRDVAMIERFGPNPEQMFRMMHDTAKIAGDSDRVGPWLVRTEHMWDSLTGKTGTLADPFADNFARIAQGVRNIEVFGKLQGSLLSSVTDLPTLMVTARFNRLPVFETLHNLIRSFGSDAKEFANRAGLVADSVVSDMNRWAEHNIGEGWTAKLANATMKASLLEAWTDAVRRAFSLTQMGSFGKLSRMDWGALHESDRARMQAKGIDAADWAVYRLAQTEDWKGSAMLTPRALHGIADADLASAGLTRRDVSRATTKMLGFIADEAEYASLGQDLQTRAAVTRGTQKGTLEGEFLRSIALFKGFPMAMISRHWGRMAEMESFSRVRYGATLMTGLTVFGGLALQLKDLKDGKDPRNMNPMDGEHGAKFWMTAMFQGGGMGIVGDLLYQAAGGMKSQSGISTTAGSISSLAGPVAGSAAELLDVTLGNAFQAARGEETHAGAEAFRFARSHLPFVNLWYAKAALDHAALNDMQEMLSPGYLSRVKERTRKDWGNEYWWGPGDMVPERAPNLGAAAGN